VTLAAADPGVRGGTAGAGGPLPLLDSGRQAFFDDGRETFQELDSVDGSIPDTEAGLGPRFNLDSCAGCHAHPAVGGSAPAVNPQVALATFNGARNVVPSFITVHGPVREARFVRNPDGTPDGGVHALFVIAGRRDANPRCDIAQENFALAVRQSNVVFRIPTPIFGGGLVEAIEDSTIVANKNDSRLAKRALGISGHENRSGNDGTITRFGWKAQNKSVAIFAGEAYNVEQGISNELFMHERDETAACLTAPTPNDTSSFDTAGHALDFPNDVERFAFFMRFSAPPTPAPSNASINAGRSTFSAIGCALCHTPSLRTGPSEVAALSNQTVNLFSDLLVHDMGQGLADGVSQGNANGNEFRTAPLWGVGQRIFFLHDGRTSDIQQAIRAHASRGSEANAVIARFNGLRDADRQNVLNFLRSL
jgi:CxxC motif-containing protein (DUF1111 family)